ncbi:toll/interleukin-1 receptor domain-containing protein [Candidatus Poribacteria bacterium]|nr:toll/interleukin-1 receptor domain-containing protein [Candidatus Poribacteria bacterium]
MNTPKVFISYSHSDQEWTREFAETMVNIGLNVWFDEFNIKAGQSLGEALEKGFRESDVVVLLINSENVNRPNLFFEIGAALGMNKRIIPVVSKDFETYKLPLPLQRIKFLVQKSPEETAKELATAIEAIYGEAA